MKLFFVFALLSLASSQTLYLSINLKNAPSAISATHLKSLSQTLPYLLSSAIPDQFQQYVQYIQAISTESTYNSATQIATVNLYFPGVPVAAQQAVKSVLSTQIESPSVRAPLSAILPGYLNCLTCEFDSMSIDITAFTPPTAPPTSDPPVSHIVGLKLLIGGATRAVPDSLITTAKNALSGLLDTQINQIYELPEDTKDVLKDFVKKVDITQVLTTAGLWVKASFPAIPANYIDMYVPLFDKYIVQNTHVHDFIAQYLPGLLGCSACTLAQFELLDDVVPASLPSNAPTTRPPTAPTTPPTAPTTAPPTAPTLPPTLPPTPSTAPPTAPTASPTALPTAAPTTETPTLQPTAAPTTEKPTLQPTAAPTTEKPTLQPTAAPTTEKPTLQPTIKPTATIDEEESSVSTLTPAYAFLVVVVGVAALV